MANVEIELPERDTEGTNKHLPLGKLLMRATAVTVIACGGLGLTAKWVVDYAKTEAKNWVRDDIQPALQETGGKLGALGGAVDRGAEKVAGRLDTTNHIAGSLLPTTTLPAESSTTTSTTLPPQTNESMIAGPVHHP